MGVSELSPLEGLRNCGPRRMDVGPCLAKALASCQETDDEEKGELLHGGEWPAVSD